MKKVLFLLCFVALIFVVGCGNSSTSSSSGSTSATTCKKGTYECKERNGKELSRYCEDGSHWKKAECDDGCNESTGKCYGDGSDSYDDDYDDDTDTDPTSTDPTYVDPTDDEPEDPVPSDGCANDNLGKQCTTDNDCGACMICVTGGKCVKGCTSDSDCSLTGTHCNIKLARCLNIYASNSACSEANCPTGCCYAEKGLTGLRCAAGSSATAATCGLCPQYQIYSPSDSKCLAAACSSTTDDCPSINSGATNPPAKCYSCKAGELVCKANTATSGCSAGFIVNMNECVPSGRQCIEGVSECCSGMPCIQGFCY